MRYSDVTLCRELCSTRSFPGRVSVRTATLRLVSMLCDITRRCAPMKGDIRDGMMTCLVSFMKKGCGISLDRSKDAENLKRLRHWRVKKEIDMMLCNAVFV